MFFGIYFHQLDDKGRIRLPSKLRAELGGSFYCMKGFDNTILVYSVERFNKFCQSVVDMPLDKVESQRALTEIISYAFKI
ncbi:MAG: MraZ N-terminal domain containing protein, partial [Clostridia bacterium]|nr:MraZ N-terminal domain containing protein [Clostridia bacterium]